jgi:hypothetical protein
MLYSTFASEFASFALADVEKARARHRGIWARGIDRTRRWTRVRHRTDLASHALWPKLFRRVHDFLGLGKPLSKLDDWMRIDPENRDDRVVVGRSTRARLHELLQVDDDRLRFRCDPVEIVFVTASAWVP